MSTPRPTRTRPTPRDVVPRHPVRDEQPVNVDDEYDDETPEEEPGPADAQEAEARGHYVTADLCGEPMRIVPPGAWRQSWQRNLNQGNIDAFAENVLHPDDVDRYYELDPTNDELGAFVGDAASLSGESLGKSRGPAASSRRTRRR